MIRGYGIEKVAHSGFSQRHCHAMPADDCWRHDAISASPDEFAFGLFFRSAGDDVNAGVQVTGSQHHVNIISIIGKTTCETARVLHSGFDQTLLECCVSREHWYADIHQCFTLLLVALDYQEHAVDRAQASYQMRSDSACATDDKMIPQFAHFS